MILGHRGEFEVVKRFMEALSESHDLLRNFAVELRRREGIVQVTHWTTLPLESDGYAVECFVDAELKSRKAVSWRIEITGKGECWTVRADISLVHQDGQDMLEDVMNRQVETLDHCIGAIQEATANLVASTDHVDDCA